MCAACIVRAYIDIRQSIECGNRDCKITIIRAQREGEREQRMQYLQIYFYDYDYSVWSLCIPIVYTNALCGFRFRPIRGGGDHNDYYVLRDSIWLFVSMLSVHTTSRYFQVECFFYQFDVAAGVFPSTTSLWQGHVSFAVLSICSDCSKVGKDNQFQTVLERNAAICMCFCVLSNYVEHSLTGKINQMLHLRYALWSLHLGNIFQTQN